MKSRLSNLSRVGVAVVILTITFAGPTSGLSELHADPLDDVLRSEGARIELAQASQKTVDAIADETRGLGAEYRRLLKELSGLGLYNDYTERQIENQGEEVEAIRRSIDGVSTVERQIMPLMIRMVDTLERFIELDVAFLPDERKGRISNLRDLMVRADLSVSEKFRRLTEAYQIEIDYGRTIETYKDTLDIDGSTLEVSILRVGRIGLYYQTADASRTGRWDQSQRSWATLGGGAARNQVRKGLKIAQQLVAPDLLLLDVAAPEVK